MIKIALTKGRIEMQTCELLKKAEFDVEPIINKNRELKIKTKDNLEFILVKSYDVLTYIEKGIVDIGIVGSDTLLECINNNYKTLLDLNIGKCFLALCGSEKNIEDNFEKYITIATKYPNISQKFFEKKNQSIKIVKLNGSVELGPMVGLSDAIVDIVETGETLKANGLKIIEKVCNVSTQMITSKSNYKNKQEEIQKFVNRLKVKIN